MSLRTREIGEDVREVLSTFDKEGFAFGDCRAHAVGTNGLFGEDEARREFEVVQRRGQPVCLTAFQHLGVAVGNDHRHLHATEVIYELVQNRSYPKNESFRVDLVDARDVMMLRIQAGFFGSPP